MLEKKNKLSALLPLGLAVTGALFASSANAIPFTTTSILELKGSIVLELKGSNGVIITTVGNTSDGCYRYNGPTGIFFLPSNSCRIGIQSDFNQSFVDALGGGLSDLSVGFTLVDERCEFPYHYMSGNNVDNYNQLLINGINFGNWNTSEAQGTNSIITGNVPSPMICNKILATGFLRNSDPTTLSNFFATINPATTGQITFDLFDNSIPPYNFSDFIPINIDLFQLVASSSTQDTPEPDFILGILTVIMLGIVSKFKLRQDV